MAIRKTRGTQLGSQRKGPRGQRQAFRRPKRASATWRRFDGTNWQADTPMGTNWQQKGVFRNMAGTNGSGNMSTMSVAQYAMGLVSVGILFYVIGYSYSEGKKAA